MQISLGYIADVIDGHLVGSPDKIITGIALIDDANSDQITLVTGKQTLRRLHRFQVGAVIVPADYDGPQMNVIKVRNTQLAFAKAIVLFYPKKSVESKISSHAEIHSSATLGEDVFIDSFASIGARAVIGNRVVIQKGTHIGDDVVIGDDTILSHNVTILPHTHIGKRVVIQSGSVIGCDGFGYVANGGNLHKIPHEGHVIIEDDVEIGACNTIEGS